MERELLKERLNELHQELQSSETVDPEVQELLEQVSGDIAGLLMKTAPEGAAEETAAEISPEDEKQTLLGRLLNLTEEFEDSHPQLAEAIGRVASALSRIGI